MKGPFAPTLALTPPLTRLARSATHNILKESL